jgi:hypothetical protein
MRWHRATRQHRKVLLGAGVGVGKTEAIAFRAVLLAIQNAGLAGLVVSHVYAHVKNEIRPRIKRFLKEGGIYAGENIADKAIFLTNGSRIFYGSADRPASMEGRDVAWALGDEIRFWKREAYDFFCARVRTKGAPFPLIGFTSTLDSGSWMADEFRDTAIPVVHGTTYENQVNLQDGYIEGLQGSLSPELFRQYVLAEWINIGGTVYGKELDFGVMLQPYDDLYDPRRPVLSGVDFGYVLPAAVFAQHFDRCRLHGHDNCLHILGELVPNHTPTTELARRIRHIANERGWVLGELHCDPAGNAHSQEDGKQSIQILRDAGLDPTFSLASEDRERSAGVERVRAQILNASGQRRLYIADRLQRRVQTLEEERGVVASIQRYPWKGNPPEPAKDSIYGHSMDALRYLVNGTCKPTQPIGGLFKYGRTYDASRNTRHPR